MSFADAPCQAFICAEDIPASGECVEVVDEVTIASAIDEASLILYLMSGRRVYGLCEATVRPSVRQCAAIETCARHCTVPAVRLGERINRIRWVMIDGQYLQPTEYRVIDRDKLVRSDGYWPHCQHLGRDLTEVGTWGIRYEFGSPPDAITRRATIDLALELIKLAVPGAPRKLPGNVSSVSRRGVSLTMQDRNQLVREAGSYIESVNQFMAAHNPMNEPPTFVWSPDQDRLHTSRPYG